jgi:hypothetical protein
MPRNLRAAIAFKHLLGSRAATAMSGEESDGSAPTLLEQPPLSYEPRLEGTTSGTSVSTESPIDVDTSSSPVEHEGDPIDEPLDSAPRLLTRRERQITRNMTILGNIEVGLREVAVQLDEPPSLPQYYQLRDRLRGLSSALGQIRMKHKAVQERKSALLEHSIELSDRISTIKVDAPLICDTSEFNNHVHLLSSLTLFSGHHYAHPINSFNDLAQVVMLIGAIAFVILGVGRRGADFLMSALSFAMFMALKRPQSSPQAAVVMDPVHEQSWSQMRRTIEGAMRTFGLEGRFISCAICPQCHALYEGKGTADATIYPERCTFKRLPASSACNEPLLSTDMTGTQSPIKPFLRLPLSEYEGAILSNASFEAEHDRLADDFVKSMNNPFKSYMRSAYDGQFVRSFMGPITGKHFLDRGEEGRSLYSLNVDGFNIEGNTHRGAKTSCMIIALIDLALPEGVRTNAENIFLAGIIPGPKEPALTDINHYVEPLILEFVESWNRGIRYSRTALHAEGRLWRSAIVSLVCDLPGGRKLTGLASQNHRIFCFCCDAPLDSGGECNQFAWQRLRGRADYENWKKRDVEELRRSAIAWRDAAKSSERNRIFDSSGVRWSPCWHLPYYNPVQMLVVDGMHCLFRNLAEDHARDLLKLDDEAPRGEERNSPAFTWPFSTPLVGGRWEPLTTVPANAPAARPNLNAQRLVRTQTFAHMSLMSLPSLSDVTVGHGNGGSFSSYPFPFAHSTIPDEFPVLQQPAASPKQPSLVTENDHMVVTAIHAQLTKPFKDDPVNEFAAKRELEVLRGALQKRTLRPLAFVAKDLGCLPPMRGPAMQTPPLKADIAEALARWVCEIA